MLAADWFIHCHNPKNNMLNVLMEVCLLIIRNAQYIGTILEIVRYCSYSLMHV